MFGYSVAVMTWVLVAQPLGLEPSSAGYSLGNLGEVFESS